MVNKNYQIFPLSQKFSMNTYVFAFVGSVANKKKNKQVFSLTWFYEL